MTVRQIISKIRHFIEIRKLDYYFTLLNDK